MRAEATDRGDVMLTFDGGAELAILRRWVDYNGPVHFKNIGDHTLLIGPWPARDGPVAEQKTKEAASKSAAERDLDQAYAVYMENCEAERFHYARLHEACELSVYGIRVRNHAAALERLAHARVVLAEAYRRWKEESDESHRHH